jgi:hypothetical protein
MYQSNICIDIQIICANQAFIHRYKNLKKKLYNCDTDTLFIQECLRQKLIRSYFSKKFPITSKISNQTHKKRKFSEWRTKLNFYIPKHKLKKQLHYTHIELANIWGYFWQHIKNYINEENCNIYLSASYLLVISHPNIKCYIARDSETAVQQIKDTMYNNVKKSAIQVQPTARLCCARHQVQSQVT